ncbi:MAG: UDP-3-O-[3-hydroxymyristoyl] N-acetylglucosamine deacetylase [Deltaproteobacteria bacterium]|nr:MAG: UDP-3-O-[3-hydroxymyristoyl] N-acetylglucosamine deacetylase [Deltaproteobacteria bacterium]
MNPICIVDDQPQIGKTISSILNDEGYSTMAFEDAESFWHKLDTLEPALVLLDIWLPGVDGMEVLKRLRKRFPKLPVIMMSGHAGIETAVKSIQEGAHDFMEKPLDLEVLLNKVQSAISQRSSSRPIDSEKPEEASDEQEKTSSPSGLIDVKETTEPQRTIGEVVVLNGVGLLSGQRTGIILSPLGVNEGIVFQTLTGKRLPGHITYLENFRQFDPNQEFSANSTTLKNQGLQVRTIEHLMATLSSFGISNVLIKVDNEVPNVDGSAKDFTDLITEAGTTDQLAPQQVAIIKKKIAVGKEDRDEKHLFVEPLDGFEIKMRVNYPEPIGEQTFTYNPEKNSFSEEIAPARSFNTFENIEIAQRLGKVGSGYLNSHIIMHEGKVINTELRFPDEFVRHKILDLLGDLYLLGYPLRGRVTANMTSHGYNHALVEQLYQGLPAKYKVQNRLN